RISTGLTDHIVEYGFRHYQIISIMSSRIKIPNTGIPKQELIEQLNAFKNSDVDWRHGRSWSLVYYGGDEHTDFLKDVYNLYFSENAAGPALFPSLQRLEAEVVAMVLDLLGASGNEVGTMTSGGNESILLAVKAYRDRARNLSPRIAKPEILVPESAHPSFLKAAHYFDLHVISVPLNADFEVDLDALRDRISNNTVCMVASAPGFPQGVMDPVQAMGEIALKFGIGLHVDACLGGFLLPFMHRLGYYVPEFDFRVPGVTSISADLHKNGYAAKGASAVLYRTNALRRYQYFVNTKWSGGMYASPTMMGTRPAGPIAAAWASMMSLGQDGYMQIAQRTMDVANALMEGISSLPGLNIIGQPAMSVFAFNADDVDVFALGDRLDIKGWRVNRQNHPRSLHMIATPNHVQVVEEFLADLREALENERRQPSEHQGKRGALLYGGTANIGDSSDLVETALSKLDELYRI
ncbi:MAG: aspartate aminotransferase family protein, partial [Amphritea sp.]|nr:aspartate aminotransferase family protein [Amphritea sp.]